MSDTANDTTATDDYDPWVSGDAEPPADTAPEDQAPEVDEAFLDELFGTGEQETGEAVEVREQGDVYSNPYKVGLQDKMWIPVLISEAAVDKSYTPRFSKKVCIAEKTVNGKRKRWALNDEVEEAIRNGATEVVVDLQEMPLPFITASANHVAPRFRQRRFDYEIAVPAFCYKMAPRFKSRSEKTGFPDKDGRTLRVATGVTSEGDTVTLATLPGLAEQMNGKIVMAQVSISESKKAKYRPVLDAAGERILVRVDPTSGNEITVFKAEEQQNGSDLYIFNDDSGKVFEESTALLVEVPGKEGVFAIRESGEASAPLQEEYHQINDYINGPFLKVPERRVTVGLLDGSTAEGEITWDTVGAIARNKTPGVHVDVLLFTGAQKGWTVTATWLGVEWSQIRTNQDGTGQGMEEFTGAREAAASEEDRALASM